ncbi:MAG: aminopeptidase, partial [Burkholderiales bacterium]
IYDREVPAEEKLAGKARELGRLRAEYGNVVPAEPNNAFLVSVAVYTQMVPGFERLLADSGGNLPAFYDRVRELAASERSDRQRLSSR